MRLTMGEIVITQKHPNGKQDSTIIVRDSISAGEFINIMAGVVHNLLRDLDNAKAVPKVTIDPKGGIVVGTLLTRLLRLPNRTSPN